ncbi:MAG TPA: serine--tRNA ligase [Alphaproteobacteria bacterium]|jgi:seryl-tRNA synthetase|nr:serine--tRNA ligase [Alphaproteobacteria bacterium]
MLDIQIIRDNPEKVKQGVLAKRYDPNLVDEVLKLDLKKRGLLKEIEEIRAQRNAVSRARDIEKGKEIKEKLQKLEPELSEIENKYKEVLCQLPNLPSDDTPLGADDSFNQEIKVWGEIPKFDFEPEDHMKIADRLGLIETEKASKISGARFNYLMGDAVKLQFALIQFTINELTNQDVISKLAKEAGVANNLFVPMIVPDIIKADVMKKMDRFDPIDDRYYLPEDDSLLIGSAEHTLGPLHMDEIFDEKFLPIRYLGYSTSFRREAGTYGKDTAGIFRRHQFDKLEMETFTTPENGQKEQNFLVGIQEYLMQALNLPYHLIIAATGDMGKPDYRHIDLEVWLPSQKKYRETHTSDYMTDYQARRLNTKVKLGNKIEYVYMNDATAFAMGRTIIAILENYQQKDGSVKIPEVLQKWMGKSEIKAI